MFNLDSDIPATCFLIRIIVLNNFNVQRILCCIFCGMNSDTYSPTKSLPKILSTLLIFYVVAYAMSLTLSDHFSMICKNNNLLS